jgi:hypothetical protein
MIFSNQDRYKVVILSAAKDLSAQGVRSFAALRMTLLIASPDPLADLGCEKSLSAVGAINRPLLVRQASYDQFL